MEENQSEEINEASQDEKIEAPAWEKPQEKKEPIVHKFPKTEEEPKEKEHIKLSKTLIWQIVSGVLLILLIIAILTGGFGIKLFGSQATGEAVAVPEEPAPAPEPTVDMVALADDDAVKGEFDAPVTIIEFSDYECPFCARFYSETLGQIDQAYIQTGQAKLIFRDFPLSFHANAQKAAEAAECAGEQGSYYEMHDKLFGDGVAGGVETFKQYAADLGLDTAAFDECLDTGAMAAETAKDMQDGANAGVRGTPAFLINGQLISGAQPFEAFKQIIDAELAK